MITTNNYVDTHIIYIMHSWLHPVNCGVFCCFFAFRDVDDIHDMMDDISEQNEIAEEISGALSQPIGFNQELDDVRALDTCL